MLIPTVTSILLTKSITSVTNATPVSITASPRLDLFKRDQFCGSLGDNYPDALAPSCIGDTPICTFSAGLQGCCDLSGDCTYYTTCLETLATTHCADDSCLSCSGTAPYCTKYEFFEQGYGNYDAYACGALNVAGTTIYGTVGSVAQTQVESGSQTFTNDEVSSSTQPESTSSSSSSSQAASSATGLPATSTDTPDPEPPHSKSHLAPIVGGTVGGIAFLCLAGLLIYKCRNRDSHELYQPQQ